MILKLREATISEGTELPCGIVETIVVPKDKRQQGRIAIRTPAGALIMRTPKSLGMHWSKS